MSHPARSTIEPPGYDGHFVMIPLTHGKFAIVDEADAEMALSMGRWAAYKADTSLTWYASRSRSGPYGRLMHRVITGRRWLDHVNRNGLDNRRINLRPATAAQNLANKAPTRLNTSGYKGVSWHRGARQWVVNIRVDGRTTYLGLFSDVLEAARTYNAAALKAWGEFAWLNPVPSPNPLLPDPVLPPGLEAHEPAESELRGINREVAVLLAQAVMEFPRARHWARYLAWRAGVKMGKMNPVLRRLVEDGWLNEERDQGREQWRYYMVTETGREGFAALLATVKEAAA